MDTSEEKKKKKKRVNLAAIIAKQEAEKEIKAKFIEIGLNPETFTNLKMTGSERDELNKIRILKLQVTLWNTKNKKLPKFGV